MIQNQQNPHACIRHARPPLDRLKQVATAEASLLLFCPAAPSFHEQGRFIFLLQINNHSCSVLRLSHSFYHSFIFSIHPLCRVSKEGPAEPFTALERTHLAQWACLHECNVIRPHLPVRVKKICRRLNGQWSDIMCTS